MIFKKFPIAFILILCLASSSCSLFKKIDDGSGDKKPAIPNANSTFIGVESVFDIQFIQDGMEAALEEGVVQLKRSPFSIFVNMQEVDGVYLNAANDYNQKFEDDNSFDDLESIYPKIMAEPAFNQDRELYLSKDNYSYWFYDKNLDWHRLSDVQIVGNKVIGEKVVQNLIYPDSNRKLKIENVGQDLYLFFFAMDDKLEDGFQIRQRQYIKVEWL